MSRLSKVKWFGDEVIKKITTSGEDALFEGGEMLLADAKGRVPKRTGDLGNSGYVSSQNRSTYKSKGKSYHPENRPTKPGVVVVGFASKRRHFVEFGTRKMRARPYMRPAFDALKARLGQQVLGAWGRQLKRMK